MAVLYYFAVIYDGGDDLGCRRRRVASQLFFDCAYATSSATITAALMSQSDFRAAFAEEAIKIAIGPLAEFVEATSDFITNVVFQHC